MDFLYLSCFEEETRLKKVEETLVKKFWQN